MDNALGFILALLLGIVLGVIIILVVNYFRGKNNENKASKIIDQAKKDAEKQKRDALLEIKEESYRLKKETEKEVKEKKAELKDSEDRLLQREKNLDKREELLNNRDAMLDQKDNNLLTKQKDLQEKEAKIDELMKTEMEQLEAIAKFSKEKAHDLIMKRVEENMALEIADYIKEQEAEAKLKANDALENIMKEITIEGLLSIQAGENPRVIEEKLKSFLAPSARNALSEGDSFGGDE